MIFLAAGGEDGIRTHEALLEPTPLAGERLRPLGHLSVPAPIDGDWMIDKVFRGAARFCAAADARRTGMQRP